MGAVGSDDGYGVGSVLGSNVASTDGEADGIAEGTKDASTLGSIDGAAVGTRDGADVGSAVTSTKPEHTSCVNAYEKMHSR